MVCRLPRVGRAAGQDPGKVAITWPSWSSISASGTGSWPTLRPSRQILRVKEIKIADDGRFVIGSNPGQAEYDASLREIMTGKLTALIAGTDRLSVAERAELRGRISTRPGLNRFLRATPEGPAAHHPEEDHGTLINLTLMPRL